MTNQLRSDLASHCLNMDLDFHNARTPGEMIERIDGDMNALSNFFSQFVIQVLGNALLLVGVLVFLYLEDWRVGKLNARPAPSSLGFWRSAWQVPKTFGPAGPKPM